MIAGQFFQEGDRLSLTLEAIDVEKQVAVWRQSLVVGSQELISLREQVGATVERDLLPRLGYDPAASEGTRPTVEAAYDPYLRSLAFSLEVGPNEEAIALLERAVELALEALEAWVMAPEMNTHAVLIVRGGAIAVEWMHERRTPDDWSTSWSMAKSVGATLVGIAIDEGQRGAGWGPALYRAFEAWVKESGRSLLCAEVNTEPPNPRSLRFHDLFGFDMVAQVEPYGTPDYRVGMMEKRL